MAYSSVIAELRTLTKQYNQQNTGSYKVKYLIDTDVDYLFVVVENGAKYFIPKSTITNKRAINVCNDGQYEQYCVD